MKISTFAPPSSIDEIWSARTFQPMWARPLGSNPTYVRMIPSSPMLVPSSRQVTRCSTPTTSIDRPRIEINRLTSIPSRERIRGSRSINESRSYINSGLQSGIEFLGEAEGSRLLIGFDLLLNLCDQVLDDRSTLLR